MKTRFAGRNEESNLEKKNQRIYVYDSGYSIIIIFYFIYLILDSYGLNHEKKYLHQDFSFLL
jgi:hypothetical protein